MMVFLCAVLALPFYCAACLVGIISAYLADGFRNGYKSAVAWLSKYEKREQ